MSGAFARVNAPLSIVTLTYLAPAEAIDACMAEHVDWLRTGYEEGVILASGRMTPRTGGVIVMRGERDPVAAVAATDPFVARGLATVEVTGFVTGMVAPALAGLLA